MPALPLHHTFPKSLFSQINNRILIGDYHRQSEKYLLSRIVGLFLCRIFLNFPLKSLGGNGSRGELAMRPRTTSSRASEQSVSLPAMSLTALSSSDMLDGREPTATSIILPKESFEAVPGFPLLFLSAVFNFFFFLFLPCSFSWSGSKFLLCRHASTAVSSGLLMCFNPCTCQGSSASYSNIHELGRYWIT